MKIMLFKVNWNSFIVEVYYEMHSTTSCYIYTIQSDTESSNKDYISISSTHAISDRNII
jgi:hypothetical protein